MIFLDGTLPITVPEGANNVLLDSTDATSFRSVAGSVGYMASSFCLELGVECFMCSRNFLHATIGDARKPAQSCRGQRI